MDTDSTDNPTNPGPTTGWPGSSWVADSDDRILERSSHDRMIAGVAGGIAEYFDVDPVLVRIGLVVLAIAAGIGVPLYIAAWLLMPDGDTGWSVADDLIHHVGLR